MKKSIVLLILTLFIGYGARAQSEEAQQLLLNAEKLMQFKQILKDMKKGYDILNGGYKTIKNLSEGNFNLHQTFLDALMQVSPTVKNYRKVADIISFQQTIIKEYKSAFSRFRANDLMSTTELDYISGVYSNLVSKSLNNLEDLAMIITANKLRMSDDERLEAIDRIYDSMEDKLIFLRDFNNNTSIKAMQMAKEKKDANAMQSIYGIK